MLVLRSRPATYRKPRCGGLGDSLGLHGNRQLATLIRAGNRIYNRQAARLEHGPPDVGGGVHVCQIAVPEQPRGVTRLRADVGGIAQALRAGAKAMASAVLAEPIDLCWEPVVRRAIPGVVPSPGEILGRSVSGNSGYRCAQRADTPGVMVLLSGEDSG